jgi:hypothetical protein
MRDRAGGAYFFMLVAIAPSIAPGGRRGYHGGTASPLAKNTPRELEIMRKAWLIGVLLLFNIGAAVAHDVDTQENLTADNWEDAAAQLRCEALAKHKDGSWTVRGALVIDGRRIHHITGEHAAELARRCPAACPKTLGASQSGC